MALHLYSRPDADAALSDDSPFTVTFDGTKGGAVAKKIYLRNDHLRRWYSNITIEAIDSSGNSMVSEGVPGFFWKLSSGDREPFPEEWDLIAKGNLLTIVSDIGNEDFGDITTYIPIWVRVEVPSRIGVQTIRDIVLRIDARERYVNG